MMPIAARLKQFLDQYQVSYQLLNHPRSLSLAQTLEILNLPPQGVLRSIPITDGLSTVLAVVPWTHEIDFLSIELELGCPFQPLSLEEADTLFCDCEVGSYPPLGEAYGLPILLDKSIEEFQQVYFEVGSHTALLQMSTDDFHFLTGGAPFLSFAYKSKIKHATEVIITNPYEHIMATAPHLPLLTKKIVEEAAISLQTFDKFSHIALNRAIGKVLRNSDDIPLGGKAFWQHALYCATLAEKLSPYIKTSEPFDASLCYLLGFTHNFGFLLFEYLYNPEFRLLNKWMLQNPNTPIEQLEKRILGMGGAMHIVGDGHTELGAWFMTHLGLPEPFITVARAHHSPLYHGPYSVYVSLIQLTNQLLKEIGIGEGATVVTEKHLKILGISLETAHSVVNQLIQESDILEKMALDLAS